MIMIGFRNNYKPAFIFSRICESKDALIAPDFVSAGRLINMQKWVKRNLLIISDPIHKAESIKRTLKIFSFP